MQTSKEDMSLDERIREIQKSLLRWYEFAAGSRILYIGKEEDALAELLSASAGTVVCLTWQESCGADWQEENRGVFDYLVSVADLEKSTQPQKVLAEWKALLKPDGRMLLGMNNRLGLRYFCGDRDPYTGRSMDSIEDYKRAYVSKADPFLGKTYDKEALKSLLRGAGIERFRFFSVLSDLKNPAFLYAEDYLPNEDLANRVFPTYNHPETVFLEEEPLYDSLIRNGMFHEMANAWLIECSLGGGLSDVCHVTGSTERGKEDALLTIIHKSGIVEKRAVYPEGEKRLEALEAHGKELKARGLRVVEGRIENGVYQMPYVEAESGQLYLKRLLQGDKEEFLAAMDHFRDLILASSEIEKPDTGDGEGAILRKGYLDLVPLNSFFVDGEFVFYDQEFCREHYPANVLFLRMIGSFYLGNGAACRLLPVTELYERYGLTKHLERWQRMEWEFLGNLLKRRELQVYYERCRRDPEIVNANRQRMNYSEAEYQRLFGDIFKGTEARKLVLFGSGTFAGRFLAMYGRDHPVWAVIDNNESRWGKTLEGIEIRPPELLKELEPGDVKIFICIKNYLSVMKQLEDLGLHNYSIFDPSKAYPRTVPAKAESSENADKGEAPPKKYPVGYVAGGFDMFHAGHLNLLRKAKEQCGRLIVGLVSDEGVYRKKGKYPVIPCKDRLEIVRACRYVDRAEELPVSCDGIRDAYKLFRFDCQFTGDDHTGHPGWMADKEYLEKQGAELVFFPYTERVSSTKLRQLLKEEGATDEG